MPRPQSDRVSVRFIASRRLSPWGVFWRAYSAETSKREREGKYFATETEARACAATVEAELAEVRAWLRRLAPAPRPEAVAGPVTLRVWALHWLDTIASRKKGSTWLNYEQAMRLHILPHVGDVVMSAETMTAQTAIALAARTQESGLAWSQQRNILRVLSACLRWAAPPLGTLLPSNPVRGVIRELRDVNWIEPPPNPLTFEQQAALLTWLQTGTVPEDYTPPVRLDDQPVDRPRRNWDTLSQPTVGYWYPLFLLLLQTGMRRGEATALRWDAVFLEAPRPYLIVRHSYSDGARRLGLKGKKQYRTDGMVLPKSGKERKVWLSPELVVTLRELARTRRERALQQRRELSPLVFVGPKAGRRLTARVVDNALAAGMAAIGATEEAHTIHALRDTFATLHLERHTPIGWVSAMLGHSKVSTTFDRYVKWIPTDTGTDYAGLLQRPDTQPAAAEAARKAGGERRRLRVVSGRRRGN